TGGREVGVDQLVPRDVASGRVVDVGRDRRRARRGAERAGDVTRVVGGVDGLDRRAGELRRGVVQFVRQVDHVVVAQRDRVGVERVRLDDVCAGLEVLAV